MSVKEVNNNSNSQRLKWKIELNVSKIYAPKLKEILKVVNDKDLGDYFMRFLLRHTVNELANHEDYLENYTNKIIETLVKQLAKNNATITQDVLNNLLENDQFYQNLIEDE